MARLLYSWLLYLTAPLVLLRLFWRARRQPAYRAHLGERFGLYSPSASLPTLPTIWIHAVSVGEMRAAQPLVAGLRARYPAHRLLLTCMTPTGRETAEALYGDAATIAYCPYDFPGAVGRFFDRYSPGVGVLMETELWPNLLAAARRRGLPVVLANARLSEKSARGYRRFKWLSRPAIASLAAVAAQSSADGARLAALGARNVTVCGNLKFDVAPDPEKLALGRGWRSEMGSRPVWLAASTRDGEEAIVLDAFARLAVEDVLLIIVPRHPQRFDEVAQLLAGRGIEAARRSAGLPDRRTRVWLGDSMGEMPAYYAAADLALIGGSLRPFGSQNLIEACACGCPVIVGPSDFNFAQATADALAAGAAQRVEADPDRIAAAVDELIGEAARRLRMRAAAESYAAAHRGATARTLAVIAGLVDTATAPAER